MCGFKGNHKCGVILGHDIFSELQIDICFSDNTIWGK